MSFADDDPDVGDILLTADQIQARIAEIGAELTEAYRGRTPLLVCVLKGAYVFLGSPAEVGAVIAPARDVESTRAREGPMIGPVEREERS